MYPDSRNPFAYPELIDEGLEAWTVPRGVGDGRIAHAVAVDVTDQVDRKIRALLCHETQHLDPERHRDAGPLVDAVHGRRTSVSAEGRSAEAFQVVDTR